MRMHYSFNRRFWKRIRHWGAWWMFYVEIGRWSYRHWRYERIVPSLSLSYSFCDDQWNALTSFCHLWLLNVSARAGLKEISEIIFLSCFQGPQLSTVNSFLRSSESRKVCTYVLRSSMGYKNIMVIALIPYLLLSRVKIDFTRLSKITRFFWHIDSFSNVYPAPLDDWEGINFTEKKWRKKDEDAMISRLWQHFVLYPAKHNDDLQRQFSCIDRLPYLYLVKRALQRK